MRSHGVLLATVSFLSAAIVNGTQLQLILVLSIVFYALGSLANLFMHILINSSEHGEYECWVRVFFNFFWLLGIGGLRLETR